MWRQLSSLWQLPKFPDAEQTFFAGLTIVTCWLDLGLVAILAPVFTFIRPTWEQQVVVSIVIGFTLTGTTLAWYWARRGQVRRAGWALCLGAILAITSPGLIFDLIYSPTTAYLVVVVIAALLLGQKGAVQFGVMSLAGLWGMIGLNTVRLSSAYLDLGMNALLSMLLIGETVLMYVVVGYMRQALTRSQRAEDRLRAILNNSQQSLILFDRQGQIEAFNPIATARARQIFGRDLEVGGTLVPFLLTDEVEPFHRNFARALAGERPTIERPFRSLTGEYVWFELTYTPVYSGRVIAGVLFSSIDITTRKQAETNLQMLNAELEQRVAARTAETQFESYLLKALMEQLPDTIYFKDLASRFTRINRAQATVLGLTDPTHALGKTDADFQALERAYSFLAEEQHLLETGEAILNRIDYFPLADGQPRWFSASKVPLRDADGHIFGLVGISRDVTVSVLTEQALRRQNSRMQALHDIALELFTRRDEDDLIQTIFTQAMHLLDVNYAGLNIPKDGQTMFDRASVSDVWEVPADRRREFHRGEGQLMWQAYDTHQPAVVDYYSQWLGRLPDYAHMHVYASANIPMLMHGQCVGVLTLARAKADYPFTPEDLQLGVLLAQLGAVALANTQLYTALQKRATEIERLNAIAYALTQQLDMQVLLDMVYQEAQALIAFEAFIVGLYDPESELIHYSLIVDRGERFPDRTDTPSHNIRAVCQKGEPILLLRTPVDMEAVHPVRLGRPEAARSLMYVPLRHGTRILGVLSAQSYQFNAYTPHDLAVLQSIANFVGTALENARLYTAAQRELAERTRAETELRTANAELARSNADLEQFAYAASHDLQEPVRQVVSYTQLLAKRYQGQLDMDADEFIAFIVEGANRMGSLVKGLLNYSRLGRDQYTLTFVECDRALMAATANLQLLIAESGGEIVAESLPRVWGNETLLGLLFQNLINNALKFRSPHPPRIYIAARLRTTHDKSEWLFEVRDNGIGIAPEYFDQIFVIFQRLHTREEYPGTGIGLALCKRIVELHGGRLWVESTLGEGSTFCFTLPVTASS